MHSILNQQQRKRHQVADRVRAISSSKRCIITPVDGGVYGDDEGAFGHAIMSFFRITTVSTRYAEQISDIATGFDQEAAAVLMTR